MYIFQKVNGPKYDKDLQSSEPFIMTVIFIIMAQITSYLTNYLTRRCHVPS